MSLTGPSWGGGHLRHLGGLEQAAAVFLHDPLEQAQGCTGWWTLRRRRGPGGYRTGVKERKVLCIGESGHAGGRKEDGEQAGRESE